MSADLYTSIKDYAEEQNLELNEPATEEEISSLESDLEVTLPESYKAFLLRHNGSEDREFFSTEETLEAAEELLEINEDLEDPDEEPTNIAPGTEKVQDGEFVKGWVPFYDYGDGRFDLLDCAPGPQGTHGQVIHYDADAGSKLTASSFEAWATEILPDI